jgi:hypothetical protein
MNNLRTSFLYFLEGVGSACVGIVGWSFTGRSSSETSRFLWVAIPIALIYFCLLQLVKDEHD